MSTYENLKKLITMKSMSDKEKQTLLNKMDMFLLFNRITQEEYEELYLQLGFEIQENNG